MIAAKTVHIMYIGQRPVWADDKHGSGMKFERNKSVPTPAWLAILLLRSVDFQDMRSKTEQARPIDATRPPMTKLDMERETDDLDQIDQAVQLHTLTKAQMAAYAMRAFGVRVDPSGLKDDVTDSVRNLMRGRRAA